MAWKPGPDHPWNVRAHKSAEQVAKKRAARMGVIATLEDQAERENESEDGDDIEAFLRSLT